MDTRAIAVAAVLVGAMAGCSSDPPPAKPQPGTLAAGTAQVTINGQDAGTTEAVQCMPAGTLTTITTGDDASGVTAMVSNKAGLVAESVSINNLGGFTGSYNADLGGTAKVTMTGATYDISGTADGFATDNPSFRTGGTFAIKVSC
jgi:ipoprotein LpqH